GRRTRGTSSPSTPSATPPSSTDERRSGSGLVEQGPDAIQLGLGEDRDARGFEAGGGHAHARSSLPRERAVVHLTDATGGAALLEHRGHDPVRARRRERRFRTGEKEGGHVPLPCRHPRPSGEDVATVPALDFGRRPRDRKATRHLGTQRHDPSLGQPAPEVRVVRPRVAPVVADALTEEAGRDQDLLHPRGSKKRATTRFTPTPGKRIDTLSPSIASIMPT